MPFDLLNCLYLQTEGVQGTGLAHMWVIGHFKDLFPQNWCGLCQQVESNNTTAKKSPTMDGSVYS